MNRSKKVLTLAILAAVGMGSILPAVPTLRAKDAETAPATAKAAAREDEAILKDLQATSRQLSRQLASPRDLIDETKRAEVSKDVTPLLKKMVVLMTELGEARPELASRAADEASQMRSFLSLMGDEESAKALEADAQSKDKDVALRGKLAQKLVEWWKATKDEKAQGKILDGMKALAKDSPKNDRIAGTLMMMKNMGPASKATGDKAVAIVTETMNGRVAEAVKIERAAAAKKEQALNKPVELAGKTVDGKDFSTKEYKGKVILVDFWATWCGPCIEELPRVKEIYKKYHEKGLEIVGISCDGDGDKLVAFTKKESMTWVQLWDKEKQSGGGSKWHELATKWGVDGIPTMYLIDRNGVLRTMEARGDMEEMIPKLLEEKVKETPATTTSAPATQPNIIRIDGKDIKLDGKKVELPGDGNIPN